MALLRMIWILLLMVVVLGFGLCGGLGVLAGVAQFFSRGQFTDHLGSALFIFCYSGLGLAIAWGAWKLARNAFRNRP